MEKNANTETIVGNGSASEKRHYLIQEVSDAPPQLMLKGRLCNFFLEYGEIGPLWRLDSEEERSLAYISGYKDAETHEIVINAGGFTPDLAISNLLNQLSHSFLEKRDKDGKSINVVNCILSDAKSTNYQVSMDKHFVVRPNFMTDQNGNFRSSKVCPLCGSENTTKQESNFSEAGYLHPVFRYSCECGHKFERYF